MKILKERTISGLHDSLVASLPKPKTTIAVLDIGCGTGAWLQRLSNLGFTNLHGIDLDIKQFETSNATCSQANLDSDDLGLGEKRFDLITSIELIEHLENPGRLLHHVANYLTPNGLFLLTTPNIHSVSCRLRFLLGGDLASFDQKGDPTHIYPVLLTSLRRILPRYSLEISNQWRFPAHGSLIYTAATRIASSVVGAFVPTAIEGDTLCLMIKRQS